MRSPVLRLCCVVVHIVVVAAAAVAPPFDTAAARSRALAQGKHQHELLRTRATEHTCFHEAVGRLVSDCDGLSTEHKRRLAIALANCHLHASGRPSEPCSDNSSVKQCTLSMTEEAFAVYTAFFTHADNICFYIQSDLWHTQTKHLVQSLQEAASQVDARLASNFRSQDALLRNQQTSLENERQLLESEKALLLGLEAADERLARYQASVNMSLDAIVEQIRDEAAGVLELLAVSSGYSRSVLDIHALVTADIEAAKIVGFYMLVTFIFWLFTSLTRTSRCRLVVFTLIWATAFCEWYLSSLAWWHSTGMGTYVFGGWLLPEVNSTDVAAAAAEGGTNFELVLSALRGYGWTIRKVLATVCCVIVARSACTFRDYNRENYQLLSRLNRQLSAQHWSRGSPWHAGAAHGRDVNADWARAEALASRSGLPSSGLSRVTRAQARRRRATTPYNLRASSPWVQPTGSNGIDVDDTDLLRMVALGSDDEDSDYDGGSHVDHGYSCSDSEVSTSSDDCMQLVDMEDVGSLKRSCRHPNDTPAAPSPALQDGLRAGAGHGKQTTDKHISADPDVRGDEMTSTRAAVGAGTTSTASAAGTAHHGDVITDKTSSQDSNLQASAGRNATDKVLRP